jgi:hypothetical protein
MLVEHKLLPDMESGLWETDDVAKWNEWALHETDIPQSEGGLLSNKWDSLGADEVTLIFVVVYKVFFLHKKNQ